MEPWTPIFLIDVEALHGQPRYRRCRLTWKKKSQDLTGWKAPDVLCTWLYITYTYLIVHIYITYLHVFVHARLNVVSATTLRFSFPKYTYIHNMYDIYIQYIIYIYNILTDIHIYINRSRKNTPPKALSGGSSRANDFGLTLGTWFQHHRKSEWSNSMYFGTRASVVGSLLGVVFVKNLYRGRYGKVTKVFQNRGNLYW